MLNPKTTLLGYGILLACVAYLGQHLWMGTLSLEDLKAVLGILGGAGLIASQDGGH